MLIEIKYHLWENVIQRMYTEKNGIICHAPDYKMLYKLSVIENFYISINDLLISVFILIFITKNVVKFFVYLR